MRAILLTSVLLTFVFLLTFEAPAAEEVPTPVKARLVTDVNTVAPGEPFKVGVLFEIIPNWHIYWKNSGDTGLPTKLGFTLPEGFTAGDLNWPLPKKFTRAGDITDYGYEDSVLLYSDVNVPEDLEPGSVIDIAADVSWVSCEEICIPGKAELKLSLPVSEKQELANGALFSTWESALPLGASAENSPFTVDISSGAKNSTKEIININLAHRISVSDLELYPVTGEEMSVANVTIDKSEEEGKTDIKLEVRALSGRDLKYSNLETLIVYRDTDGKRSGLTLVIPIGK